jgi:ribosomal protein L27
MLFLATALLSQLLTEPPTLRIVPLESLPSAYARSDGQEIVVAGIVVFGQEGTLIYVPTPAGPGPRDAIFIRSPIGVAKNGGELEAQYLQRQKSGGSMVTVLRGRFRGSASKTFGHQSCCRFELEITKVLSVG